jgi:hypothetical protein
MLASTASGPGNRAGIAHFSPISAAKGRKRSDFPRKSREGKSLPGTLPGARECHDRKPRQIARNVAFFACFGVFFAKIGPEITGLHIIPECF